MCWSLLMCSNAHTHTHRPLNIHMGICRLSLFLLLLLLLLLYQWDPKTNALNVFHFIFHFSFFFSSRIVLTRLSFSPFIQWRNDHLTNMCMRPSFSFILCFFRLLAPFILCYFLLNLICLTAFCMYDGQFSNKNRDPSHSKPQIVLS